MENCTIIVWNAFVENQHNVQLKQVTENKAFDGGKSCKIAK